MPPPLPGMMPHLPTMPTHPQMPQYPRPAAGPSHPDPVVPQAAAAPSPVSEPTAAGIVESPCQAVHVPAEENFFTVSKVKVVRLVRGASQFPYLDILKP